MTSQAEYSTDVLLSSHQALAELMPRLLTYSALYFEAREVMAFLGRKVHGNLQGDVVTDQVDFGQIPKRRPGCRVRHGMLRGVAYPGLCAEAIRTIRPTRLEGRGP